MPSTNVFAKSFWRLALIVVQVFGRDVVLRYFLRLNLCHVSIRCIFDAANRFGLEVLPFFC